MERPRLVHQPKSSSPAFSCESLPDQPTGTPGQMIETIPLWQAEMYDRRWKETKWLDYPPVHSAELEKHKDDPNAWFEHHPMDKQGKGVLKAVASGEVLKAWRPARVNGVRRRVHAWSKEKNHGSGTGLISTCTSYTRTREDRSIKSMGSLAGFGAPA